MLQAKESRIDRLRREARNIGHQLTQALRERRNACIPCRDDEKLVQSCKRSGGRRYCDNCADDPDRCAWDEGTALLRFREPKPASELTAEDMERIILPLSIIEEHEQLIRTQQHLPDPDTDEPHIFTFGTARHSSNPGAPGILRTMQNLVLTLGGYNNNVVGHPLYAASVEGHRPGGPGTPMLFHRLVMARHGSMPIPTHHGNLLVRVMNITLL